MFVCFVLIVVACYDVVMKYCYVAMLHTAFKKGDRKQAVNYRPVSLTSAACVLNNMAFSKAGAAAVLLIIEWTESAESSTIQHTN